MMLLWWALGATFQEVMRTITASFQLFSLLFYAFFYIGTDRRIFKNGNTKVFMAQILNGKKCPLKALGNKLIFHLG